MPWKQWLDGLDDAAAELQRRLATGEEALFPELPAPPATGPDALPAESMPRALAILDRLERLTGQAEHHREALAGELAGLPRPQHRPSSGYNYELGATLDIAG